MGPWAPEARPTHAAFPGRDAAPLGEFRRFDVVARHPTRPVLPDRPRGSPSYLDTRCPRQRRSPHTPHGVSGVMRRIWARAVAPGYQSPRRPTSRQLHGRWRRYCPEVASRSWQRPRLASTLSGDGEPLGSKLLTFRCNPANCSVPGPHFYFGHVRFF